jgi:hypothetical protein
MSSVIALSHPRPISRVKYFASLLNASKTYCCCARSLHLTRSSNIAFDSIRHMLSTCRLRDWGKGEIPGGTTCIIVQSWFRLIDQDRGILLIQVSHQVPTASLHSASQVDDIGAHRNSPRNASCPHLFRAQVIIKRLPAQRQGSASRKRARQAARGSYAPSTRRR